MTDRLGLLRSILANPADDLPRLVYADWLEENGTTDADAARAELIRLWHSLKTSKTLGAWLQQNCWRLWPTITTEVDPARSQVRASGRFLKADLSAWNETGSPLSLTMYFDRGFSEQVLFDQESAYRRFWLATAIDEPLASFEPSGIPCTPTWPDRECMVPADFWGQGVYERLGGFDRIQDGTTKVFALRPPRPPARNPSPSDRARTAVRAAMTARAREANGLTPPPTESA